MSASLLYAIGTLAAWTGGVLLLAAVFSKSSRVVCGVLGGVLLLAAAATPAYQGGLAIPLIWIVMPFPGWAALGALAAAAYNTALFVSEPSRRSAWTAALWLAAGIGFALLYLLDPESRTEVLRGRIELSPLGAVGLAALLLAALASMSSLGRRGKAAAAHVALLAGSIIFGLPFAWLLLTSFKEERDLVSANGLVWVPRVQQTLPYFDPEEPLYEGQYEGHVVWGTQTGMESSGLPVIEIQRPASLRGISFASPRSGLKVVPRDAPLVSGRGFTGFVARELNDGRRLVRFLTPPERKGMEGSFVPSELEPIRQVGLRFRNYTEALEAMPPETRRGLLYLRNTLLIVVLSVLGTLLSSSLVAYGFARLRFPGRDVLFKVLLATMMLPGAVTLMPQFLLFRSLGWIDTLYPLWVPAFFAGAFNVFLLRQFFSQVPSELEDAGKIDGAGVLQSYWRIMLPQVKPALAVVAIWTFMGAWNNFLGPLIYINTPENMPLSYALQLFQTERSSDPNLMMAFASMTLVPFVAVFFFAQRYFIEGVTLSGLGGR